jgi:hypothetical protein
MMSLMSAEMSFSPNSVALPGVSEQIVERIGRGYSQQKGQSKSDALPRIENCGESDLSLLFFAKVKCRAVSRWPIDGHL